MTHKEFVVAIAKELEISQAQAETIIVKIFDEISECMAEGERVSIKKFGSFFAQTRLPRDGHNPNTLEKVFIPEVQLPKFRPYPTLKRRLNPT
jgi:nucleoid DNA-binding protein